MELGNPEIKNLSDFSKFRSAPEITKHQLESLLDELKLEMQKASWFTVGIMASSAQEALFMLRKIERKFDWEEMKVVLNPDENGPVFLKANQSSGEVHLRIEHGLGEGVIITCHHPSKDEPALTLGPMPMELFLG